MNPVSVPMLESPTVVYGSNEINTHNHAYLENIKLESTDEILEISFSVFFIHISSDLCHKKMLLESPESLNLPFM